MSALAKLLSVTLLLSGSVAKAETQSLPDLQEVTARDLYVGCSLLVTDNNLAVPQLAGEFKPQSPAVCLSWSLKALAISADTEDGRFRFCPQSSLEFQAGAPKQMALAFLEFYESRADLGNRIGFAAMVAAFQQKWPCEK